jgi:hypothetical protein
MRTILHSYGLAGNRISQRFAALFIGSLLAGGPLYSQQSYSYHFGSQPFASTPAGGPVMQTIGTVTTPLTVVIPETTCPDQPIVDLSHFEHNSGFAAKAFFTSTYTIEVIFQFDELDGYNRIIDFSNSLSDNGIYTLSSCLNFYPTGNIGPCPDAFDTVNYHQLVVTRDGAGQAMNVYLNGELFTTHIDAANHYVIGAAPNDSIKFFRDDQVIGNEASSGNLAFIRMADFALSQTEVEQSYADFCLNLTSDISVLQEDGPQVFPNPATDRLHVILPAAWTNTSIEMLDARGAIIRQWNRTAVEQNTSFSLKGMPDGVYFVRCTNNAGAALITRIVKTE